LGLVLGAFLSVIGFNSVYAQVPRSISYQGLLVKNNQPVNGAVSLHLIIYDAAGTNLYEESQSAVNVNNGLFTVQLGGNSGTLPQSLKFDEQYYLGVNVDGAGELPQRTPFTASPYALNSQTVGGVGVSVTPQNGMLLPLDQNGKFPKSVLPLSSLASINTIDGVSPDGSGNIKFTNSTPALLKITDNVGANSIDFAVLAGSGGITAVQAGPGLTGGGSTGIVTIGIGQNGITNGMLGVGVVTARNLDQNIPQYGLYMDQFGQLNVGIDPSFSYYQFGSSTSSPAVPLRNIGLNLAHTNNWTAVQNFLGGFSGSFGTIGSLGVNGNYLTVNGLAEPLAAPNGALYEIIDNGDLKVTGSSYLVGNTYIGAATNGGTNTMGTAGQSANTIQGITNNLTATNASGASSNTLTAGTSNNVQSPANNIGTTQAAGNTNTIGTASNSANTITGASNTVTASGANTVSGASNSVTATGANTITAGTTNTITATGSNSLVSVANNIGTTTANSVNIIGNAGTSTNTVTGGTNNVTGTTANNVQAPTNNVGTTQVAGGINNIGTAGVSTNNINGLANNNQANTVNVATTVANAVTNIGNTANNTATNIAGLTATMNATTNNIGTQATAVTNNIGTGGTSANNIGTATSTNTINGTTTFNGNGIHNGISTFNGNIVQTSGTSTLLNTQTGNLTVIGSITQSGGNAQIHGSGTNMFGDVGGSVNTIGAAGSLNTITGGTNSITATTADNISAPTITLTGNTTATGGSFTSTGNSFIGTTSTTNTIGNPGSSTNTMTGLANNFTATTVNTFTGNIVQASGSAAFAPTASTTNSFGTGASQINNFGSGASATNSIGGGAGSVNNLGVVSGGGISTNNIGNLNSGTNNNVSGTTTFTGATLTGADGNQILRITGGPQSCAGPLPTALTSQMFADGDVWIGGTASACRLNIFGAGASCIGALNTTTFGACAGGATQIVLISGINGNAIPNGNPINITNIDNIQANTNIKSNVSFTVGNGANATTITPGATSGSPAITTPSVPGRMPTFQAAKVNLVPGTGPSGGGSFTFTSGGVGGLTFEASGNNDGITVTYLSHTTAQSDVTITFPTPTTMVVESGTAADANQILVQILRP
jgi:fibronectin-binding autotransporter adhesin